MTSDWVTIAVFDIGFEAGLVRGRLEAAGIRALVPEQRGPHHGLPAHLQILESDRDRAIVELRRMQSRLLHPASSDEE